MSALQVSDNHIAYLLLCAKRLGHSYERQHLLTHELAAIGRAMKHANALSLTARYPDKAEPCPGCGEIACNPHTVGLIDVDTYRRPGDPKPTICPFAVVNSTGTLPDVTPIGAIKAAHFYMYQCDEHDSWEQSPVLGFVQSIVNDAIRALPGYDAFPWGIA